MKFLLLCGLFLLPINLVAQPPAAGPCLAGLSAMPVALSSKKIGINVRWANRFSTWSGRNSPQHINKAEELGARFLEKASAKHGLKDATAMVMQHVRPVEKAYRIIFDIIRPDRERIRKFRSSLEESRDEDLSNSETQEAMTLFIGVTKNYLQAEHYNRQNHKAIKRHNAMEKSLKEAKWHSDHKSESTAKFSRKEMLGFLQLMENWLTTCENNAATVIGKHYGYYAELKLILKAVREGSLGKDYSPPSDVLNTAFEGLALEAAPAARSLSLRPAEDSSGDLRVAAMVSDALSRSGDKSILAKNVADIAEKVIWGERMARIFADPDKVFENPVKADTPETNDVRIYFSGSNAAGVAYTTNMRRVEGWATVRDQLTHLTPTDSGLAFLNSVLVPLLTRSWTKDGRQQMLFAIRQAVLFWHSPRLLTQIQQIVNSDANIESKMQSVAGLMSHGELLGQYFLDMFARYYTLDSQKVWQEIVAFAKDDTQMPYPAIKKHIELAEARRLIALPVTMDAFRPNLSRISGYTLQLVVATLWVGYFQTTDEEEREQHWANFKEIVIPDVVKSVFETNQEYKSETGTELLSPSPPTPPTPPAAPVPAQ